MAVLAVCRASAAPELRNRFFKAPPQRSPQVPKCTTPRGADRPGVEKRSEHLALWGRLSSGPLRWPPKTAGPRLLCHCVRSAHPSSVRGSNGCTAASARSSASSRAAGLERMKIDRMKAGHPRAPCMSSAFVWTASIEHSPPSRCPSGCRCDGRRWPPDSDGSAGAPPGETTFIGQSPIACLNPFPVEDPVRLGWRSRLRFDSIAWAECSVRAPVRRIATIERAYAKAEQKSSPSSPRPRGVPSHHGGAQASYGPHGNEGRKNPRQQACAQRLSAPRANLPWAGGVRSAWIRADNRRHAKIRRRFRALLAFGAGRASRADSSTPRA